MTKCKSLPSVCVAHWLNEMSTAVLPFPNKFVQIFFLHLTRALSILLLKLLNIIFVDFVAERWTSRVSAICDMSVAVGKNNN